MGLTKLQDLQSAPVTLQMPRTAVAYMCRINPHGNSSSIHIYACITLTTVLHLTRDLGLYSFQRAKKYSLSGVHSLKRYILPDQAKLQKWYL